jgi:hypothetical protein
MKNKLTTFIVFVALVGGTAIGIAATSRANAEDCTCRHPQTGAQVSKGATYCFNGKVMECGCNGWFANGSKC